MKRNATTHIESRRGFSLLELIVALILIGTVTTIVIPALGWMGAQNRLALQKQEAAEGLDNLMDEITSRPFAQITPAAAGNVELPDTLKKQLPGAVLKAQVKEIEPGVKRINLQLAWNQRNGQPLAPIRLSAWVYQREGQR